MTDTWDRRSVPLLAGAMITCAELLKLKAFWDSVGRRWTIGTGFTTYLNGKPVRQGDTITAQQNAAMMTAKLAEYTVSITQAIAAPLTVSFAAALYDFDQNDGQGRLAGSMIAKMAEAGDLDAAGRQMNGWAMSNGKIELGLLRRCEYRRRLAIGEGTDPQTVYDQVWQLGATSLMPLYNRAFTEARAWGWTGSAPAAASALHERPATPPHAAPAPSETADDLNAAELAGGLT